MIYKNSISITIFLILSYENELRIYLNNVSYKYKLKTNFNILH